MAVELWVAHASLTEAARRHVGWLTADERALMDGRVFARHRDEYLLTRVVCRAVLARVVGRAPESLRFVRSEHGRPSLVGHDPIRFNLSNSAGHVVLLVSRAHEVGVDLELIGRADEIVKLAPSVFAPSELQELQALSGEAQRERAVALWTLKESYIKARGLGLQVPLDRFAFSFPSPPDRSAPRITIDASLQDEATRWHFQQWQTADLRIATACEGDTTRLIYLTESF